MAHANPALTRPSLQSLPAPPPRAGADCAAAVARGSAGNTRGADRASRADTRCASPPRPAARVADCRDNPRRPAVSFAASAAAARAGTPSRRNTVVPAFVGMAETSACNSNTAGPPSPRPLRTPTRASRERYSSTPTAAPQRTPTQTPQPKPRPISPVSLSSPTHSSLMTHRILQLTEGHFT